MAVNRAPPRLGHAHRRRQRQQSRGHPGRGPHLDHLVGTELLTQRLPPDWQTRSSYIRVFVTGLLLQIVLQRFSRGLLPEKPPAWPEANQAHLAQRSGNRRRRKWETL